MDKNLNDSYVREIREIGLKYADDEEVAHLLADSCLCDLLTALGYTEVVEAFDNIDKWYS